MTNRRRSAIEAMLLILACLGLARAGHAQVTFEWSDRFAAPGLPAKPNVSVMHDFGSGPELCVALDIDYDTVVMRLGAEGWTSVGPKFASCEMSALVSFDSGSGPALYACAAFNNGLAATLGAVIRWDGSQWVPAGTAFLGYSGIYAMTVFDFGAGPRLCVVKTTGTTGIWTWNGTTWALLPGSTLPTNGYVGALASFNDGTGPKLFAGEWYGAWKWTGSSWLAVGPANGAVLAFTQLDTGSGPQLYAGGTFTQIGGVSATAVARWNGATWSALSGGALSLNYPSSTLKVTNLVPVQSPTPLLYVGGAFSHAGALATGPLALWNGAGWSSPASGYETFENYPVVGALLHTGSGGSDLVYVGGNFTKVNGIPVWFIGSHSVGSGTWNQVPAGQGALGGSVFATCEFDSGNGPELIVGGSFLTIGGIQANRIARWNGTSWLPLGAGITNGMQVNSLAVWDDGNGPALYAGGEFTAAGGIACNNIAKWDGATWSPLGPGLSSWWSGPIVRVLMPSPFPPNRLIAGGAIHFTGSTQNTLFGLAQWDGNAWGLVGNSDHGSNVWSLAVYDDGTGPKLYAGGQGGLVTGVAAYGLQRYDGNAWSPVPGWVGVPNAIIRSLAAFDDGQGSKLYMGFSSPPSLLALSGSSVTTVATLGTTTFTPVIDSLRVFDDGDGAALYVSGSYSSIGGVTAGSVARYRSGTFAPLTNGLYYNWAAPSLQSRVWTIGTNDDGSGPALVFGGDFDVAGSLPSSRVAKWGAAGPVLSIDQPAGPGSATFVHCSNLQVGREYFNIASLETCGGGPGTGPWLGLCAADPTFLLLQASLPLPAPPFHFLAPGTSHSFGPYGISAGVTGQAITIDVTGGHLWRVSAVASIVIQ